MTKSAVNCYLATFTEEFLNEKLHFLCSVISYLIHSDTLLKMRQMLLENAISILLQNATKVYYKLGQIFYYKMRQFYYNLR